MKAHKHQGTLSTLYEENGNDYDTHLRNTGTMYILRDDDIRLFC